MEVFYTFRWGRKPAGQARPGRRDGNRPQGQGKPKGKPRRDRGKPGEDRGASKPKSFEARPPRKDKIDPDNPFAAALMGLKDKT